MQWKRVRVVVLAVAAGAIFLSLFVLAHDRFVRAGALAETVTVFVPRGLNLIGIADLLAAKGVLDSPLIFVLGVRLSGAKNLLQAGEFAFPAHVSARGAMQILEAGRTVVRRLTVPEGLTTRQVLTLIREAEGLEGDVAAPRSEGKLLPETYHYSRGDARGDMVARMARSMRETLDALWEARDPDLPLKTRKEALTLASIVEKETAVAEERPRIAAVFLNRLKRKMRLQSDPTVVYGLVGEKGSLEGPLTRRDLERKTPYNTYLISGLPPGPICNPGRSSIKAVVHPAETQDLYFVADGSGGHAFAETLAEHNRNVARWRKVRKKR